MTFTYIPRGVCSRKMTLHIEGDILQSIQIEGGCSGNLQGITHLVEGMPVAEVIRRLEGIKCGFKSTSCPDQLSQALKAALAQQQA